MKTTFPMRVTLLLAAAAAFLPVSLRAEDTIGKYKAELIAADVAFAAQASRVGVYEAFMSVATPDTKLLSEGGKGFDAVKSGYKNTPPTATLTWAPTEADVSKGGDLGYTWGRYEYRDPGANGKAAVETGTYVTIWRRQADGSWKVLLDGGQPDPKAP
jgi:ketosteroid isomerase-like protein